MFRQLALTALVATAIAAAPIATPQARAADPHDIIGGAVVLGVIGAIIANENRKRHERQRTTTYRYPQPQPEVERYHQHRGYTHKHVYHGDHSHRYVKKKRVRREVRNQAYYPRQCLRQKWTRGGWVTYYSRKCLTRNGY